MRIGNIEMPLGAALAPMAGVTDANMRLICARYGCAWSVSEMLSAKGYIYSPEARVHSELLTYREEEGICGLQLFGCEKEMLSEAVKRLNDRPFAFFDFNMGCPAHKIVANGEGSALMKTPLEAAKLVEAMVKAARKPVTVKIRAGWDSEHINAPEVAKMLEESGAQAITVHPRTREMFYSGKADWNIIAEVKQRVAIPVIGNGDIRSSADAVRMINETGCDGIMAARAAQGNPWLFTEIKNALEGKTFTPPSLKERIDLINEHMDMQIASLGKRLGVLEMRKHIAWYLQGLPGSNRIRARVNLLTDADEIKGLLNDLLLKNVEDTQNGTV